MKKTDNKKVIYYTSYTDDVVYSKNQEYKLDEKYKWIHTNIFYRLCAWIIWKIVPFCCFVYYRMILGVKTENQEILKKYKNKGYFVYGNHTQPVGDAFMPTVVLKKRYYAVASQANLGIPVLGRLLTMLGAIVIPNKISQTKEFLKAVDYRVKENNAIIIYPEGHVWPYYTKIRPFPDSAFKFQVENNVPAFCMTTTYYKYKNKKKPKIRVYIDGPFFADNSLKPKDQAKKLNEEISLKMQERCKNSNYEYIEYRKKNR